MRPCCKLARLNLNKKGPWTQLPHSLSISSNPNRLIRYDLAIDYLTYHLSVLLLSYVLLPPPVFTTCLLPRNIPSEYAFFCRPHASTHFFFGSVSSSPAVPVTSVSILFSLVSRLTKNVAGSHVVHVLQETRRYKVVSIDNFHNSYPRAFSRLEELARSSLPPDASETEKESTVIDAYRCDLTNPGDVRAIFEKYGKGGIWGVVHIAVRFHVAL